MYLAPSSFPIILPITLWSQWRITSLVHRDKKFCFYVNSYRDGTFYFGTINELEVEIFGSIHHITYRYPCVLLGSHKTYSPQPAKAKNTCKVNFCTVVILYKNKNFLLLLSCLFDLKHYNIPSFSVSHGIFNHFSSFAWIYYCNETKFTRLSVVIRYSSWHTY